eukprot:UN01003
MLQCKIQVFIKCNSSVSIGVHSSKHLLRFAIRSSVFLYILVVGGAITFDEFLKYIWTHMTGKVAGIRKSRRIKNMKVRYWD